MDYGLISAELINKNTIIAFYYGESHDINEVKFQLQVNDETLPLKIARFTRSDKLFRLELLPPREVLLGDVNTLKCNDGESKPLDYRSYVLTPEFDELYTDKDGTFGASYSKEETSFSLWSPLSDKVFLKLEKNENNFVLLPMKRKEKGVYNLAVHK